MANIKDFALWVITNHPLITLAAIGFTYGVVIIFIVNFLAFGDIDDE